MPIMRELAQIMCLHRDKPFRLRPTHNPVLEDAREESRKDSDDLKSHGRHSRS
jgi:hypothetical protein